MTFTKEEQIQAIYDLKVGYTLGHADIAILKSMARQLLASMEQEPIAWLNDAYLGRGVVDGEAGSEDAGPGYIPVYREPTYTVPPAPVSVKIPPEKPHTDGLLADGWNACRAAMLQGAEPAKSGLTLREGLAAIRSSGIAIDAEKIKAERDALNEPTCWCHNCCPVTVTDMRFVVCPDCGNKRCPHANDHRNTCTGSNEPGQEGSAYPAAPQQEAK